MRRQPIETSKTGARWVRDRGHTSLDPNVTILRPVTADSGRLRAVGKAIQRGRRIALAQAQVVAGRDGWSRTRRRPA